LKLFVIRFDPAVHSHSELWTVDFQIEIVTGYFIRQNNKSFIERAGCEQQYRHLLIKLYLVANRML